jgi:methylmalonyl-CoA mutase cobalamin-binding domain/chain
MTGDANAEVLGGFERAIREYDSAAAAQWASRAVAEGLEPLLAFDVITQVMADVGDRFERGEMWLPDMVGAAEAVQAATPVLQEELRRRGGRARSLGTAVMGAVKGDIHSIGIQTVCSLLTGAGFDVHYLGIDVPPERFVAAVKEHDADLLGLSALLTTTASEARAVLSSLEAEGLRRRVKVMIGGGAITADFAAAIGADAYGASAAQAVDLARGLVERSEEVAP